MFTTPCIFHPRDEKQREEAINWAKKIGYQVGYEIYGYNWDVLMTDSLWCPMLFGGDAEWLQEPGYKKYHDCDTNIELFKALAALRDDSDYMQWIISEDGYWFLNGKFDVNKVMSYDEYRKCRKSTPEELVEYFTKKNDMGNQQFANNIRRSDISR